jgi:hypothetical protein
MRRDAILPSQEPTRRNQSLTDELFDTPSRSESLNTSTMLAPRPSTGLVRTERSLPPIPVVESRDLSVNTQGTPRQGHLTPISPSIYAPSRPVSRTSTTTQSCCGSPSIANLGRLSVVKQRLAQIERNSSQSSSSGLTSPMWSPQTSGHSSCTTPSINLREQDHSLDGLELWRPCSVRNAVDVILSSYGDANELAPHVGEFKEHLLPSRDVSDSSFQPVVVNHELETLHDRGYCLPMNLDDRVLSSQHDVQDLAQDTANISKTISKIDQTTEVNGEILRSIEARMITAEEHQKKYDMSSSSDASSIFQALHSMRQQLATDIPAVLTTLVQIQADQATGRDTQEMSMSNINATRQKTCAPSSAIDPSGLHAKLDDLLVGCNAAVTNNPSTEVRQLVL